MCGRLLQYFWMKVCIYKKSSILEKVPRLSHARTKIERSNSQTDRSSMAGMIVRSSPSPRFFVLLKEITVTQGADLLLLLPTSTEMEF